MNLKSLMVDVKSAWIPYPGFEGFEVEVSAFSRERLVALRKSCLETQFDRRTKQPYETLNDKKFIRKFTDETIKNWRGLKLEYVERMMLVDISGQDPNVELPYDQDNAEALVSNSADFDTWMNEVAFDLDNFRAERDRGTVEKTGSVAE